MSNKHELSPAEKYLIVKAHTYFKREKDEKKSGSKKKIRDRVVECLGFSGNTVSRVMADYAIHWGLLMDRAIFILMVPRTTNIGSIQYQTLKIQKLNCNLG